MDEYTMRHAPGYEEPPGPSGEGAGRLSTSQGAESPTTAAGPAEEEENASGKRVIVRRKGIPSIPAKEIIQEQQDPPTYTQAQGEHASRAASIARSPMYAAGGTMDRGAVAPPTYQGDSHGARRFSVTLAAPLMYLDARTRAIRAEVRMEVSSPGSTRVQTSAMRCDIPEEALRTVMAYIEVGNPHALLDAALPDVADALVTHALARLREAVTEAVVSSLTNAIDGDLGLYGYNR